VALWATQRYLPLEPGGTFARGLEAGRAAANGLHARLMADDRFLGLPPPDLDILVFAPRAATGVEVSARSTVLFEAAARSDLHLALISLEPELLAAHWPEVELTPGERVTCVRCCLMKPEHRDWLDAIWSRLSAAVEATARSSQ
jgi:hypothetical protein